MIKIVYIYLVLTNIIFHFSRLAQKLQNDSKDEVLAKDANTKSDDWFDIYDPRNALTKRRREKSQQDSKERKRAKINN